jgi:hypothetical protein
MFLQLSTVLGGGGTTGADLVLTEYRPSNISEFLEAVWASSRATARNVALGLQPADVASHQQMARSGADLLDQNVPPPNAANQLPPPVAPVQWHHIVYAYLLENTRMVDIFQQVIFEWTHGERLPPATIHTHRWLQVTEQLFFADAWPYSVRAVTSRIRNDAGMVRRNAYYRLLGMDLNHGADGGPGYFKPEAANRDFAVVFEALLGEVWRGYTNRTAFTSQNLTDDNAIVNLVRRLQEMLQARRLDSALSREEFDAVSLMSWLHLVLRSNTRIVNNLNASANGVADRLKKIGERVGIPAHSRSDAYLQMAEPLSRILLAFEGNAVPIPTNWPANLYGGVYVNDMLEIITQWSIATGRDVKEIGARPTSQAVLAMTGAALSGTSVPASRLLSVGARS